MSMIVNFSPELSAWIQHNLDRGCNLHDLVKTMVEQKFDPKIAHALVDAFATARSFGNPPPSGFIELDAAADTYIYETPRLASAGVIRTYDREIRVLLRMQQPIVALLENVLSPTECEQIINLARARLQPSTVVDPVSGENKVAEHRDSEGMFFNLNETPFIAVLDKRISEIMNCPIEHGEGLQVLRYGVNAKNTPHFDFLAPSNQANRDSLARSGQRISTLVVYLNEVSSGGETVFPELGGLAVSPKPGNAVYFEYANSLRQVDLKSVHAGAPVYAGEKWALTKWMRERRFIPAPVTGSLDGYLEHIKA
ncbi:MAG: 2OG-Fe(II) oxygenase [Methylomonas sp.]|jgi:prolyl 4-hydroxylase